MRFKHVRKFVSLSAVLLGCTTGPAVKDQPADGTFQGVTDDGRTVVMTVSPRDDGYTAHGSIDGQPVVFSGARIWRSVGVMMEPNGSYTTTKIELAPDGESLTIELEDQPDISLERGGTPPTTAGGPFTGSYRPSSSLAAPWRLSLQQNGDLITGVAQIIGEAAFVAGRVTEPDTAACVFMFADESQIHVDLKLDSTGESINLRGIGNPVEMNKF